ncbi:DHHW protein [Hathewaya proteolytica DSM 3090]|uniref:DHHW protein n=1 Tax=Hathewaya proteolytica DSM 3090 TaxID=1121331 RepID=A0A1M6SKA4_9CLOT|nr:DHHW family protein [Hathewaya proteolytica]SHK45162.1 DHHW protein [Hathewaya proteolytica DSM 3090]
MNKKERISAVVTLVVFMIFISGFFIINLIYKSPEISISERRKLAKFKPPTVETVFNKEFMRQFDEKYVLDNFAFRDSFRHIKAFSKFKVFGMLDNNDVFLYHDYASKMEKLNQGSIIRAGEKINKLSAELLSKLDVYYSIIPDKNYYISKKGLYPSMDYGKIEKILNEKITEAEYIDLFSALKLQDYYKTDLHWDQIKLSGVVEQLSEKMNFEIHNGEEYDKHSMEPFYGAYYGQSSLPLPGEKLTYISNEHIREAKVMALDEKTVKMKKISMYNKEAFNGIDPYDVFLWGAQPLITIENENAASDKELYIFRDSFSSSLAPLLISAYSKITLIDLRYIASPMLPRLVDFKEGSQALFLYGTMVLNNSDTLMVK